MENAAATNTATTSEAMGFMIIFNIFIGVYLLYYAIRGTGKLYENEYPEKMQAAHRSLLRKFCWITGAGMLVLSILEYMNQGVMVFAIVSIVFVLGCVVVYYVLFRTRFGEYIYTKKENKPAKKDKNDKK